MKFKDIASAVTRIKSITKKMKARKKLIKGKYNALIRRPVRKPGIKTP